MAVNNRVEAQTVVDATLVPTLTLAQHKVMVNDNILNSVVFDKDVIASETPVAGAVTIDFSDKDLATVTTAVDLAVSFTNLENGAVKYLEVTKAAANVISFVGASDMVDFREHINTVETVIVYRVSNKNGSIYVEALFTPPATTWNSVTLLSPWIGFVKYKINNITGKIAIEINVNFTGVGAGDQPLCDLPTSIQPDRYVQFDIIRLQSTGIPNTNPDYITKGLIASDLYWGCKIFVISKNTTYGYYASFEYYKTL